MDRTILHIDCNSFYASVECLHHPEIRGKPVAVGGDAEKRHGIILTRNGLARRYGVKTGEALWQAKQKCPELVIMPPDYPSYLRFSRLCREIYRDYSPQVESFGLDECWMDASNTPALARLGARGLADEIRERVKLELGITVSVGVSFNKVFAKLGSDYKKPDAVTCFPRETMREQVWPIPVSALLYVGPATTRRLNTYGIHTIGDLALTPVEYLQGWFGKNGLLLHCFAAGMDSAPVAESGARETARSVGNSTTTPRDLTCEGDAAAVYWMLCESVAERLRDGGFLCSTVQISLRDTALFSFERQVKLERPSCLASELHQAAMALLRQSFRWTRPLRSIGVRACDLLPADAPLQLDLFADTAQRERLLRLERTMDELRRRFGHSILNRASAIRDPTLGVLDRKPEHVIQPAARYD